MKIALTQPKLETGADFTLPYSITVLSAWIKHTQPNAEVYYSETFSDLLEADEVWCTAVSESWNLVNEMGEAVVNAGKRFLVGGHHATALPETLLFGETFRGPVEGALYDINKLPMPDWSILPRQRNKQFVLMTSRGCPYHCTFCSSAAFWKKYTAKSPARVIAEIKQLRDLSAKSINIFDDLFTVDKKRLKEIVKRIKEEELDTIKYSCLVRADSVDEEVIDLLCDMNVHNIAFGSESGSDSILKMMNKKASVSQNINLVYNFARRGIKIGATSIVLGHPGESPETLHKTKQYIEAIRPACGVIEVYPLIPYPGTQIWEYFCKKYSVDVTRFDWSTLRIASEGFSWDAFYLLSDDCTTDNLKEFYEWNEKNKILSLG